MYKGKYQKSAPAGHRRKKPGILIISLVLLLALMVSGTVAYLLDFTGEVTNTFTPAQVKVTVDENKDGNTKSNICFTNPAGTAAVPVYIRATMVIYWEDTDGNVVPTPDGGSVQIGVVNTSGGWFETGGIYYYSEKVAPGSKTSNMLEPVVGGASAAEVIVSTVEGYTCYVDIRAEAIQAEPESVVTQAWKDVQVENGRLKAK